MAEIIGALAIAHNMAARAENSYYKATDARPWRLVKTMHKGLFANEILSGTLASGGTARVDLKSGSDRWWPSSRTKPPRITHLGVAAIAEGARVGT